MKVAVTGGTGFVGSALVRALRARGDHVVVFTRKPSAEGEVAWTPGVPGPWCEALVERDGVVSLAGASIYDERWTEARLRELRSSRIDATRVLAQAMAARCPKAALVSASAVGFYGMRKDDVVLDEASLPGDDLLAVLCKDWEASADPARAGGIRVCHPRIGMVLGRGGGALEKMLLPFRAFVGGPLSDGQQWISWIHLDDLVAVLLRLLDDAALSGPVNATAPQPVTMNEFARELGAALHRPALFRVPSFALRIAFGADRARWLVTGQRVLPKRLGDAGFAFRYPDVTAAFADICR